MKKLIALIVLLATVCLLLTGCFGYKGNEEYYWGNYGLGFPEYQDLNAKVTSDTLEFDINNVTLDFYYCFYCLDDETIEEVRSNYHSGTGEEYFENTYAIYLSNEWSLSFEEENDRIIDYENKVNARLVKYIDYEELFDTNYGYTVHGINVIEYNYVEKLTIPAEYFDPSRGIVYIHIVRLNHWKDNDMFQIHSEKTVIGIQFDLLDENTVVLRER